MSYLLTSENEHGILVFCFEFTYHHFHLGLLLSCHAHHYLHRTFQLRIKHTDFKFHFLLEIYVNGKINDCNNDGNTMRYSSRLLCHATLQPDVQESCDLNFR